jgi:hypothetical protein
VFDVDHRSFAAAMVPLYPQVLRDPRLGTLVERIRSEERHQATSP